MKSSRLLSTLLVLFTFFTLSTTLHAQDYEYTISEGSVTITKYTGSESSVVIPDTLEGLPVTSIGDEAFYQNGELSDVSIPESVTAIGDSAFYYCWKLENLTIPDNVATIGESAFARCTSLTDLTLSQNQIGRAHV